jgi:hypothetical protein
MAYTAHAAINSDLSFARDVSKLRDLLDDDTEFAPRRHEYAASELARARLVCEAQTNDELNDRINEALHQSRGRFTTAIYALLGGAAPPLLYPIFLWILAGFRKPATGRDEVRPAPKLDEAPPRSEPPSHRPPANYYPVIARAVSGLTDNTPLARAALLIGPLVNRHFV